ncbi:MAG: type II toxin-antitoxin system YafQ family toxin [Bacteroidota bacterium]
MKYLVELAPGFKKDFKLAQKQNQDISAITRVISSLSNGEKLEARFKDHKLKGKYKSYREYHIKPDLLLIYKIEGEKLFLTRLGSHSELFE